LNEQDPGLEVPALVAALERRLDDELPQAAAAQPAPSSAATSEPA
jgi:hypothetical protein